MSDTGSAHRASSLIKVFNKPQFQEDAERLLKNCKRYDLLNEFYQSTGQWKRVGTFLYMFVYSRKVLN
jgi:hypothetical protein